MFNPQFRVTLVGLGLMGGSFALALRGFRDCVLTGYDTDENVMQKAKATGAVDRIAACLTDAVTDADLVLFCTGPHCIPHDLEVSIPHMKPGCVVTDICGVKKKLLAVVDQIFPPEIHYIGLHPMAGREVSGFDNADAALFQGAGFLLIPPAVYCEQAMALIQELSLYVGAGRLYITSADAHDEVIAYTSDLMHIAAAALCRHFPPATTMTHTAGAFRDCTRVANLDPALWTDLFIQNAEYILPCLAQYIKDLVCFQNALAADDRRALYDFLEMARSHKKEILSR